MSLGIQQLRQVHEKKLFDSILMLYNSEDLIIKRFSFKLLVQFVTIISDYKKKLLDDDALIEEAKSIFTTSSDDVLVEYSTILMHAICDDPKRVDSLGRDEIFLNCIFNKFKSHDVDILLHTIQLLNVIMRNSMLIESIMLHKDFPFKNLQIELKNAIPEIRNASLGSFLLITNLNENPFWDLLSSEQLIETLCEICMVTSKRVAKILISLNSLLQQDSGDDLQKTALMVFKNFSKNQTLLLKLSQSDYLLKFLAKFMDQSSSCRERFLSILTEFAKIDDNRRILGENGIMKEILEMLRISGAPEACEATIVMSTNIFCLMEILNENVYKILLSLAMNDEKDLSNRTLALKTFLKIICIQGFKALLGIANEIGDGFAQIIKTTSNLDFFLTTISILVKLAEYHEIKLQLALSSLTDGVFTALATSITSTSLMIRLFNLASNFMDQESFQQAFVDYEAVALIDVNLKSQSSLLRSAVCNFISAATNYPKICEILISEGILKLLINNFDCTICSDAFEAILNHDLSIKFAVRGRLESNEKIQSGFYATKGKWIDFQRLRELMFMDSSSPLNPVFSVNFEESQTTELKLGARRIAGDQNLTELIDGIKRNPQFSASELHEKIKIVALKISKFLQTNDDCVSHQLQLHLTELKFKLASSIIPLGNLIYGNSFESALLFKAVADELEIDASLHADDTGKGWNRVNDDTNVVDLVFDVGETYEASTSEARKYLQKIS